jgi:O-antigen ligase
MSKAITNFNYLILYLYGSLITYQSQLLSLPISFSLLLFSAVSILFIQTIDFFKYKKSIFLFIVLALFSVETLMITPNKMEGIKRLISLGAMIIFIYIILYRQFDKTYIEKFLFHSVIIGSIYVIASYLMFDSLLDYKEEFEGFMHNRHNISALLGIYFVLTLSFLIKKKKFYLLVLCLPFLYLYLYLIFFSFGRIGFFIIGLFIVILLFIYLYKAKLYIKILFFTILVISVIYGLSSALENAYIVCAIERGLTGRDEIADALLGYLQLHPSNFLVGFGIGSLDVIGRSLTDMAVRDVNNIVGTIFEYGLIGLFLFLTIFVNYIYKMIVVLKNENSIDPIILIPIVILSVPSETTWLNFNNFETILMYVFIAYTLKRYDELKKEKLEN